MKDWKNIGKKVLFLPLWLLFLLVLFSAVSLAAVFLKGWETAPAAYAVYVISFYTLTVLCLACWKTVPEYYKSVREKLFANPYASRYFTDAAFKTHVSLHVSFGINLLYAAANALAAGIYSTWWFVLFAAYYTILAVMRFLLLRYVHHTAIGASRLGELMRSRLCAYILILVNLILTGAVLMMVHHNRGYEYPGILIYVMALYAFYMTASAIRDMIRYRKLGSPVLSVSKIIKLAAALVSMLSLETAMFAQFGGDMAPEHQRLMIMLTGAGIAITVVGMAFYVIIRNTREISTVKKEASRHG